MNSLKFKLNAFLGAISFFTIALSLAFVFYFTLASSRNQMNLRGEMLAETVLFHIETISKISQTQRYISAVSGEDNVNFLAVYSPSESKVLAASNRAWIDEPLTHILDIPTLVKKS